MCAKKLRYPPPLDSDDSKEVKPKQRELVFDDIDPIKTDSKPRPKTYKPKLAAYLLIIVLFMAVFEVAIFIAAGDDYKYFSIYAYENDLDGLILDESSNKPIISNEINMTLENYDHEFTYLFSEVKVEDKTFYPEINNTTGECKFNNVPCGRYILKISVPGFQSEHRKVIVVPDYVNPEDDENTESFYLTERASVNGTAKVVESGDFNSETLDNYLEVTYICFAIIGVFLLIMILGMIYSFRRKKYSFALIGSIFGIMTGLITFFSIGAIIGVGSLILIIMSKEEFES